MPLIIGIAGFVGNGKTTVSQPFVQNHGFRKFSFADPIRDLMMTLGVPREVLLDPVLKEKPHAALCGASPRQAMESIGKWGRDLNVDFWVRKQAEKVIRCDLAIFDDVRHQNEVDMINSLGGQVYRLVVPGKEPRVPTDFRVAELKAGELVNGKVDGVMDIENVIGETNLKDIYEYIYKRSFGVISDSLTWAAFETEKKRIRNGG